MSVIIAIVIIRTDLGKIMVVYKIFEKRFVLSEEEKHVP
jgi:hypothetical protein